MGESGRENTTKLVGRLSAENNRGAELHDSEKHDDREHGKDEKFAHCTLSFGSDDKAPVKLGHTAVPGADQLPAVTSTTACANAWGASCGKLCPMPPLTFRCAYLPENILA
jgi:hypothetical protein